MKRLCGICVALLIMPLSTVFGAEASDVRITHEKVQEALDWQLPKNGCRQPEAPGSAKEIRDDQGGTRTEWDVDSYTLARYERKEKRWMKCVDQYKSQLAKDFDTLKNSAQYGLTKEQADIILNKMKMIQAVLSSPNGMPPAPTD